MDNKSVEKLLNATNYYSLNNLTPFAKTYIEKLIYNIITYVSNQFDVGNIELLDEYNGVNELSQEVTGIPSAYSVIDGSKETLLSFAQEYSKMEIAEFDLLCKEVIIDFLNLNNGLFVVQLSKDNICELSLSVPKQNGNYSIDHASYKSIIVIPIAFTFGNIKFLICESINN